MAKKLESLQEIKTVATEVSAEALSLPSSQRLQVF